MYIWCIKAITSLIPISQPHLLHSNPLIKGSHPLLQGPQKYKRYAAIARCCFGANPHKLARRNRPIIFRQINLGQHMTTDPDQGQSPLLRPQFSQRLHCGCAFRKQNKPKATATSGTTKLAQSLPPYKSTNQQTKAPSTP